MCLLLVTNKGFAQVDKDSTDFSKTDSTSYALYLDANWLELKKLGNIMLHNGMDYPYLRARLGTAYFYLNNYTESIKHFARALELNPYDQYSSLMHYYALKATLRHAEAGSAWNRMIAPAQRQVGNNKGFRLMEFHADAGYVFRGGSGGIGRNTLTGNDSIYGEEQLYQSGLFSDAGIRLQLWPSVNLYAGIQLIQPRIYNRFVFNRSWPVTDTIISSGEFDSYYYRLDNEVVDTLFKHQIKQQSFYGQLNFSPSANWRITTSLHLMQVSRPYTEAEFLERFWSDTAWVNTTTGEVSMIEVPLGTYSFVNKEDKFTDWSAGAEIRYHFGILTTDAGMFLTETNRKKTLQLQAGLMVMPFGNINFYTHSRLAFLNTRNEKEIVIKQTAGGRLAGPLWIEASVTGGQARRFSDQAAYLVFNSPEGPKLRTEVICTFVAGNNLQLSLRHHYQQSEHLYYSFDAAGETMMNNNYLIHSHSITGGIKWIF